MIHATFPLERAADAHRMMEESQHIGKILLTLGVTVRERTSSTLGTRRHPGTGTCGTSAAPAASETLFSPRFFLMCGFSFTVFLSAFQLLPVAPYRILALGGTTAVAGLFLGFLTYSSACTAPLTGALVDRFGPRRTADRRSLAIARLLAHLCRAADRIG